MSKRTGHFGRVGAAFIAVTCVASSGAWAEDPPYDPAIDVQLFDLTPGPRSFMSVGDASLSNKEQFSVDFLLTFLTDPFVIKNFDEVNDEIIGTRTDVVSAMFAGQLVGAYGLTDDLQLGVSLPLVFSMSGDGLDPSSGDMVAGGLQASGLGDLRVEAKGRIVDSGSVRAAWVGGASVPTSFGAGGSDYLGDDLPAVRGGAAAHWTNGAGTLRVGANAGVMLRKPRKVYAAEVGQQLTYGAGAAFNVTDDFSVIGEAFGRTGLTELALDASPLEVGGGIRAQATKSFSVLAGGGIGVVSGIGSPGLRFVVSVGYAPDLGDTDGDGVTNMADKCPLLPEDRDGFEDSDGCPDDDNDGDRREDKVDQCPNDKEDIDGFEDEDGCPEYDNDKDGITDSSDRCPVDAEDGRTPFPKDGCPASKRDSDDDGVSDLNDQCPEDYEDEDGFEDWDGCPEADNDKDGIADEDDACPLCPEDIDNFEDGDGCPDLDNDKDGIADRADQCPDEAELINGIDDEDGCPDQGAPAVATLDGNRLSLAFEVRFTRSNVLRSRRDLMTAARVMRMSPEVTKWRVVVAARTQRTPELTREKSQAQADAIRDALVAGGLDEDRLEAIGAVSPNQVVAIAAVERAEASDEDFICPASLEVKERKEPTEPPPEAVPAAAPEVSTAAPATTPAAPAPAAILPDDFEKFQGVVKSIRLKRDKAKLVGGTTRTLDEIAALLSASPQVHLEIRAHTDGRKGPEKTREISTAQASLLLDYLAAKGIDKARLSAVGKGMDEPIGDNKTSAGREANRRVELVFSVQ